MLIKKYSEFFKKKKINLNFKKICNLSYGENPNQKAAFYNNIENINLINYIKLQGKKLSFNNIVDSSVAWDCVNVFNKNTCVIVKHSNPCGAAIDKSLLIAYKKTLYSDNISSFGGIVALNNKINSNLAKQIIKNFFDVIIAPSFSKKALVILSFKKKMRLLRINLNFNNLNLYDFKNVFGGLLIQSRNYDKNFLNNLLVVTKKLPTYQQFLDMIFAWKIVKFIKSNAIVFCKKRMTIGIGAGQMSRIDSVKFALIKAKNAGFSLLNSVVASDAFFPFKDSINEIFKFGANCIIQPGGSIRDKEIIQTANKLNIIMIFTGTRTFYH